MEDNPAYERQRLIAMQAAARKPVQGGVDRMALFDLLNEHRLTGILLVLAFISFAIGATLPLVGPRGNMGFYNLPVREYLSAVAGNAVAWRWANVFMGAAAVLLIAGLTMLTTILEGAGERALSRLGFVGFLVAALLWVIFSAFRASVTVMAAEEMAATGTVPPYYEPLARWGFALFLVYAMVGFLALASYGGSLLLVDLLPAWVGWGAIIFSIGLLVPLLITRDTLPIFHYIPPLVIGIILLVRG